MLSCFGLGEEAHIDVGLASLLERGLSISGIVILSAAKYSRWEEEREAGYSTEYRGKVVQRQPVADLTQA